MSSIRQQILTAIDTRLKGITKTKGYATDIGLKVFPWKLAQWETTETPGIGYRDPSDDIEPHTMRNAGGTWEHKLKVELNIIISDGANSAATLRSAINDVYKAIGTDQTWGGLAVWTQCEGDKAQLAQDNTILGGSQINLTILYRTLAYQTDAQP